MSLYPCEIVELLEEAKHNVVTLVLVQKDVGILGLNVWKDDTIGKRCSIIGGKERNKSDGDSIIYAGSNPDLPFMMVAKKTNMMMMKKKKKVLLLL